MHPLDTLYNQYFHTSPEIIVESPGRVNLLGEHVDYNSGPVMPVAIDMTLSLAAARRRDGIMHLVAPDLPAEVAFRLDALDTQCDITGKPLPQWARYPAGVAWAFGSAGYTLHGLDVLYTSRIPVGAGLGSSAAVEVGFAFLWAYAAGWKIERLKFARLCQQGENEYVGVASGLMDQFAVACGEMDHALYFDTRNLEWEALSIPQNVAIVVVDSGIRRSLVSSAYNARKQECERAVSLLQQFKPELKSLRDISPQEFAAYSFLLPAQVMRRAEHVVKEIARVRSGVSALKRGDMRAFGALMYAGHTSLRDLYEVSISEIDTLVQIAHGLPGTIGARLTGAGFGGCTVNLVEREYTGQFMKAIRRLYKRKTGRDARVYICRPVSGARAVEK